MQQAPVERDAAGAASRGRVPWSDHCCAPPSSPLRRAGRGRPHFETLEGHVDNFCVVGGRGGRRRLCGRRCSALAALGGGLIGGGSRGFLSGGLGRRVSGLGLEGGREGAIIRNKGQRGDFPPPGPSWSISKSNGTQTGQHRCGEPRGGREDGGEHPGPAPPPQITPDLGGLLAPALSRRRGLCFGGVGHGGLSKGLEYDPLDGRRLVRGEGGALCVESCFWLMKFPGNFPAMNGLV